MNTSMSGFQKYIKYLGYFVYYIGISRPNVTKMILNGQKSEIGPIWLHTGPYYQYTGCPNKKGHPTVIAIKLLRIIRSPQKFHTVSGTLLALICALIHVPTIFYLIVTKLNVKITSFENEHG